MRSPFRRSVSFRIAKQQPPPTAYRGVALTPSSPVRVPRTGAEPMKHLVPTVADRKSQGGSLRWHRRLSVVLLRGSQSALRHLGSIP